MTKHGGGVQDAAAIGELHRKHAGRKLLVLLVLAALTVLAVLGAATLGSASLGIGDVVHVILVKLGLAGGSVDALGNAIVWELRLPRILLALVTGLALAGSGTVMQGVLRNPLVSPFTLGLSSAAAFGASVAIIAGASLPGNLRYWIIGSAFFFGMATVLFIYFVASLKGSGKATYLLSGVAISYVFSAGVSVMKYVSDHEALREIVVWLMGGLWGASWHVVAILLPLVVGILLVLLANAWNLNVMAGGEEVAASMGVHVKRLRLLVLVLATLAASATIAFTGIIGFIGLMAPHICRMLVGGDNRYLIPCSALMGAVLLIVSDTIGRTVIAPTEIPVGIITSFIGVPFFMYLLIRQRRQWWG
ncbi:FecCD family ABC transporter permease [Paenibacillus sabuli]|nr:iron ABC transporter permease [Paenibacillus sabuli]